MSRAFRLASLLRLRTLQEERAAGALAGAPGATRAAEATRRDAGRAVVEHALPTHVDLQHWQAGIAARAALGGLAAEATVLLGEATAAQDDAGRRWSEARSRSVALEKLEARHSQAVRREEDRAEQLVLDEIGSRTAGRRPGGLGAAGSGAGTGADGADKPGVPS
jgi:flagellar FliJ protein